MSEEYWDASHNDMHLHVANTEKEKMTLNMNVIHKCMIIT